jgi:hypothetical protein
MRLGKEAVCVGAGIGLCLLVGGCFGPGNSQLGAPLDARGITPRQRPTQAAPDLRITDQAVASSEIPVVPLPLPPRDRQPGSALPVSGSKQPDRPMPPAPEAGPVLPPRVATDTTPMAPVATTGMDNVRRLHRLAAERYDSLDSYIARLTRREQVKGENKPEEVMLFKFRKQPWSVYFKWLGPTNQGREVIYVRGQYENKIHTLLAAGDMPLAPAGKRMALSPDSIFVRGASRHPVTEAGLGASIERLGRIIDMMDRGDPRKGTLADLGAIVRPEFVRPVPAIEHTLPPGLDPNLPRGGRCLYCFDPDSNLPVLISLRDERGQEVEYYFYDRLQFPVRLDDNDFNPDKVWARREPEGRRP